VCGPSDSHRLPAPAVTHNTVMRGVFRSQQWRNCAGDGRRSDTTKR
jgi:hypothetical protein